MGVLYLGSMLLPRPQNFGEGLFIGWGIDIDLFLCDTKGRYQVGLMVQLEMPF
jgi:hypothetical protein